MKKQWQSVVFLFFAWLALGAPASALPIVAADSRYNIYVEATNSENVYFYNVGFDGVPEGDPLNNGITITENETVEGLNSRITITLSSDMDLFPDDNDEARFGIGTGDDGLNLLSQQVRLLEARVFFYQPGGVVLYSTDNLVLEVSQSDPWNGLFPNGATVFGVDEIGQRDVRAISFEFLVTTQTEVPEPSVVLLGGIGLLAFAATRRKIGAKRLYTAAHRSMSAA